MAPVADLHRVLSSISHLASRISQSSTGLSCDFKFCQCGAREFMQLFGCDDVVVVVKVVPLLLVLPPSPIPLLPACCCCGGFRAHLNYEYYQMGQFEINKQRSHNQTQSQSSIPNLQFQFQYQPQPSLSSSPSPSPNPSPLQRVHTPNRVVSVAISH